MTCFWLNSDVALLLQLRWKILHNAQMLLTLIGNISVQATYQCRQHSTGAQEELSLKEGGGFACALFPFKHPLRQADQPGLSWTKSTASQANEEKRGSSLTKGYIVA